MVGLILLCCICIMLGILLGQAIKRDKQKTQCPYCSCRDCCSIGYGIAAVCPDEEQKPFVCMR